jgi:hypothetical protein
VTENQHDPIVHRGTKGSNPLSSSGESRENPVKELHPRTAARRSAGKGVAYFGAELMVRIANSVHL